MSPEQVEKARKFIQALRTLAAGMHRYLLAVYFKGSIEEALRTLEQALALASQQRRPEWQPTKDPVTPWPWRRPREPHWSVRS
jgi:hypothetical protein